MVVSVWASFIASWFTSSSLFLLLNLTIGTIFLITRFGGQKNPQHHQQLGPYDPHQLVRVPSILDRVKSINFSLYKFEPPTAQTELHYLPPEPDQATEYPNNHNPPQIARTPSLLERLKSINFSLYKFEPPTAQTELHYLPPEPDHASEYPNYPDNHNQPQIVRTPSLLERLKSINLSTIYRSEQPEPEAHPDRSPEVHDPGVKRSKSESSGSTTAAAREEKMRKSASEKFEESGGEEENEIATMERRRPETARVEKSKGSQKSSSWEDDGVDAKADDFINRFKQQLRLQRLESLKRFSEMWK